MNDERIPAVVNMYREGETLVFTRLPQDMKELHVDAVHLYRNLLTLFPELKDEVI